MPKSKETRLLKYLIRLVSDYNLDSDVLINCLYDAYKRGESRYDGLTVTYRGESDGQLIFLLTIKGDVVGQFQLLKHYLRPNSRFFSVLRYILNHE